MSDPLDDLFLGGLDLEPEVVTPVENEFTRGMNDGNTSFGLATPELFQVVQNGIGGTYTAVSIDDLTGSTQFTPGGVTSGNTAAVFVTRDLMNAVGIRDGTILVVRGKRVRVNQITDDGDNTLILLCQPPGLTGKVS